MQEQHFIVDNGFRIGFFQNKEDCQKAIELCDRGFIMSKKEWEQKYNFQNY